MRQLVLVLAGLAGCSPSTGVPRSALISCEVEAHCPGKGRTCIDGTCRLKTSACVEPVGDRFQLIADGVPCALSDALVGVCNDGTCQESICGDGIVHAGVEACDPGNLSNRDPCQGFCTPDCAGFAAPFCGDGSLCDDEECDNGPGNSDTPDACRTSCLLPTCGDGITDSNEDCDDGDLVEENGCTNDCSLLPGWGCWDRDPGCNAVVYVRSGATGNADGGSWATAFPDLDSAILDPSSREIWIAAGTYVPATGFGYVITKDVRLIGGFAGNETLGDRRDPDRNPTRLSGDLNDDDPNVDDNAVHVIDIADISLFAIDTVVLDGLTISDGRADQAGATHGGGILVRGLPRVVVRNAILENNHASADGGAIRQNRGELELDDVTFRHNTANADGGAVWVGTANLTVRAGCVFEANLSDADGGSAAGGGAIAANGATTVIEDATFIGNATASEFAVGGAILSRQGSLRVKHTRFLDNQAGFGGAIHSYPLGGANVDDLVVVESSVFVDNHADYDGGAIKLDATQARIAGCVFASNAAGGGSVGSAGRGGGIFADDNVIANNLFVANDSELNASAVYIQKGLLVGNTLVGNTGSPGLFVGFSGESGAPTVANNILWANAAGAADFNVAATPAGIHNCIDGGWSPPVSAPAGVGNLDVDPEFTNLAEALDVDFRLVDAAPIGPRPSATSPLIDAGSNSESTSFGEDLAGQPRFIDGDDDGTVTVDIGAFEAL